MDEKTRIDIPPRTVLALDLMAMVKTDIGPEVWTRRDCILEAIDEYLATRRVSGGAGHYEIRRVTA